MNPDELISKLYEVMDTIQEEWHDPLRIEVDAEKMFTLKLYLNACLGEINELLSLLEATVAPPSPPPS